MKQKDVVVGGTYLTYIGQVLARVVVMQVREPIPGYKKPRLLIRRENEERCLPKLRTAAALRHLSLPNISADTGADLTGVVLHYEE
jgi:hypothetical protein